MSVSSKRILVVDDEKMIRDVVLKILEMKGHKALEAENGDEALDILQEDHNFDFIILDLSMPGSLSGKETFNQIQSQFESINIIIATGFIDKNQKDYFLNNGAHAILEKPYKIDDIVKALE